MGEKVKTNRSVCGSAPSDKEVADVRRLRQTPRPIRTCRVDAARSQVGSDRRRRGNRASAKARFDDADEFLLAGLRSLGVEDDFARVEEIDPIADFEDLVVIVDDQHDRNLALPAKVLDQTQEHARFRARPRAASGSSSTRIDGDE